MVDESFELRGTQEGINPRFGEWRQRFSFPPVSYSNQSERKKQFKDQVYNDLTNNFLFTNEVQLIITLYLEEQKVLETPEYGDLDNYAKSICDAIKGKGGLLIDDCQIQSLSISWLDIPESPYFEIEIKGSPDDFIQDSMKLYEMPDGLYYPQAYEVWTKNGVESLSNLEFYFGLLLLRRMTTQKRKLRHSLRQEGLPRCRSFQHGKYISPVLMGFHKTRILDSGFKSISLCDWLGGYEEWKRNLSQEELGKVVEMESVLINASKDDYSSLV